LVAPRRYQIIVLQTTDPTPIQLALAVNSVQGIMRIAAEQIQSPMDNHNLSANIAPYVSGVVTAEKIASPVLEFDRILKTISPA
jgi:chemotaxis signal transduction protein